MRVQAFGVRHTFNHASEIFYAGFGQFLKRNFFDEAVERNAAKRFSRAVCRQRVVRSRCVVARRFARIIADENRTGVNDFLGERVGVFRGDYQMFGGVFVQNLNRFVQIFN